MEKRGKLFLDKFLQLVEHIFFNFPDNLKFSPEREELPLVSFHIREFEFFLAFNDFHLELSRDLDDQFLWHPGGDEHIVELFFGRSFVSHITPVSLSYFDPPAHNTWAPADSPDGILRFAERVHTPSHQGRATGEPVIHENQVVDGIIEELTLDDPLKDIFRFSPGDRRPPGESDRGVLQDEALFD